ncbi:long-chain-alcohol oxidase fao1 [Quercus suber]|uniref:Long-chain-alcohol oxidase fao1 n=1 Tax=Quercus suber TaxID=58331 RepID=A0AAW0L5P7_QUESU
MKRESHPLLRGGRRGESKYSHGWTAAEMQSLASICEALLPPLTLNSLEEKNEQPTEAVQSFYKASGSQFPIPDEAAELIGKRAVTEAVILVRVVLRALGTRLGTLLLCGPLCLSNKWPFVFNFSSISLENREKILQKWFRHRFLTPIRAAVLYIKALSLYNFFSRVMPHTLFAFSYIIFTTIISYFFFFF